MVFVAAFAVCSWDPVELADSPPAYVSLCTCTADTDSDMLVGTSWSHPLTETSANTLSRLGLEHVQNMLHCWDADLLWPLQMRSLSC